MLKMPKNNRNLFDQVLTTTLPNFLCFSPSNIIQSRYTCWQSITWLLESRRLNFTTPIARKKTSPRGLPFSAFTLEQPHIYRGIAAYFQLVAPSSQSRGARARHPSIRYFPKSRKW